MTYHESECGYTGYTTEGTTGLPAGGDVDFVDYTNSDETALLSFERWAPGTRWEVSTGEAVVTGELNAPAPIALAAIRLQHHSGSVLVLGVLGASHVITIEHADTRFAEQVSCHVGGELPRHAHAPGYHPESRTDEHDELTFRDIANHLRDRRTHESGWLGGAFPGDDAALTALSAEPDGPGWRWQTWHLYPAAPGGTIVYTTSRWHP